MEPLLEVEKLKVQFPTLKGTVTPVDGISFYVNRGEVLGIVGESGCGKSVSSLALMGLLPSNAKVTSNKILFNGTSLLEISDNERRKLQGGAFSMIFQDPMTSLNPSFTVEFQIDEMLKEHTNLLKLEREQKIISLLGQVGIPAPETRIKSYPHQLSGGMSQRVMIAMSIACEPDLLIADEPTTALDVTIQAQILDLLKEIQLKNKMGMILITHDIGVVSENADRIQVMYAGHIVESGRTRDVIDSPKHPYTKGLLESLPSVETLGEDGRLVTIPGLVPDLSNRPQGCQFHPRCYKAQQRCRENYVDDYKVRNQMVKCFYPVTSTKHE